MFICLVIFFPDDIFVFSEGGGGCGGGGSGGDVGVVMVMVAVMVEVVVKVAGGLWVFALIPDNLGNKLRLSWW